MVLYGKKRDSYSNCHDQVLKQQKLPASVNQSCIYRYCIVNENGTKRLARYRLSHYKHCFVAKHKRTQRLFI